MRIIKYPQSAFIVENNGKRILIDPGNFLFEKYSAEDLGQIDAILITHSHPDHLDLEKVTTLIQKEIPLYGNHNVLSLFEKEGFEIKKVETDQEFEVAGFRIKPVDIPHCKLLWCAIEKKLVKPDIITDQKRCVNHPEAVPETVDGPPNTGYQINDVFLHPGDGISLENFKTSTAALPINGPSIDFEKAWDLAGSLGASKIIPMHYSHPKFPADPVEFSKMKKTNAEVVVLPDGESIEIT